MNDDFPAGSPSGNGHAYRAYLESAHTLLAGLTVADYYSAALPSPTDDALAEVVSAYTGWPPPLRKRFVDSLPQDKSGLFAIFGHRAATLAVRESDPDRLRLGLIGNAIANTHIPPNRNVDAALAVFYHCARKLEIDPAILFDEVAPFAAEDMAERLRAFGQREGVTLTKFGWREIRTPDGVRYKFEW